MPIIVLFTNFCDAATSPCNATTTKPHVSTEQNWCPWRESDPRPLPYQGSALPLSHMGMSCHTCYWSGRRGSNSRHLAWKASALPTELHPHYAEHPRKALTIPFYTPPTGNKFWWRGLDSNQRTQRERIYSPSPLTTRPPLQNRPRLSRQIQPASMPIVFNRWCRVSESN